MTVGKGTGSKGFLPLLLVSDRFVGCRLISVPFSDFAGPVVSQLEDLKPLLVSLHTAARHLEADYSEIRVKADSPIARELLHSAFTVAISYCSFKLDLRPGMASVRRTLADSIVRPLRKAQQEGVTPIEATSRGLLDAYYQLHLRTSKEHGVPPHSKAFLASLFERLHPTGQMRTYLATYRGRVVSGLIVFNHGDTAHYWQSALPMRFRRLNPFHLLLWTALEKAADEGYNVFDLGRTRRGTGTYQFKKGWGGREYEIHHLCRYYKGTRRLPDPEQTRYRIVRKVWQLVPSVLAQQIGPPLTRGVAL